MKVVVNTSEGPQTLSKVGEQPTVSSFADSGSVYSVSNVMGESLMVPWNNISSIRYVIDEEDNA